MGGACGRGRLMPCCAMQAPTLTRSARSPAMCPSGGASCQVCMTSSPCPHLIWHFTANGLALRNPMLCSVAKPEGVMPPTLQMHWGSSQRALHTRAGIVKSAKMTRTIIVRRNYAHFIKKYARWDPYP